MHALAARTELECLLLDQFRLAKAGADEFAEALAAMFPAWRRLHALYSLACGLTAEHLRSVHEAWQAAVSTHACLNVEDETLVCDRVV